MPGGFIISPKGGCMKEAINLLLLSILNLVRGLRRSLSILCMITSGGLIIFLTMSYLQDVYQGVRYGGINSIGHLRILKDQNETEKIMGKDTVDMIMTELDGLGGVRESLQSLSIVGLLGSETGSTVIFGEGSEVGKGFGDLASTSIIRGKGRRLSNNDSNAILLGKNIERILGLEVDEWAILQIQTVDGALNLADAEIIAYAQTFNDDSAVFMPLGFAQYLLQTDGVTSLSILLEDETYQAGVKTALEQFIQRHNLPIEVREWQDIYPIFEQVTGFYNTVFSFVIAIIVVLTMIAVFAIISFNIFERMRQLAALRAIGVTRQELLFILLGEIFFLYCLGTMLWIGLSFGIGHFVNSLNLSYAVPFSDNFMVPFSFNLQFRHVLLPLAATAVSTCVAVCIPIWRASRLNIAEVLRIE